VDKLGAEALGRLRSLLVQGSNVAVATAAVAVWAGRANWEREQLKRRARGVTKPVSAASSKLVSSSSKPSISGVYSATKSPLTALDEGKSGQGLGATIHRLAGTRGYGRGRQVMERGGAPDVRRTITATSREPHDSLRPGTRARGARRRSGVRSSSANPSAAMSNRPRWSSTW
jgi:hypothetical protein